MKVLILTIFVFQVDGHSPPLTDKVSSTSVKNFQPVALLVCVPEKGACGSPSLTTTILSSLDPNLENRYNKRKQISK